MLRTATVRFNNNYNNNYGLSKEYAYLTTKSDLKNGDLVVVEAQGWYQVALFERYKETDKATKHIVTYIDTTQVEEEKEIALREMDLREQIETRIHEVEEMNRLKELAKSDDKLKELVEELKKLKA